MTPKEKAEELLKKMNVIHYLKLGNMKPESRGLPVSMYDDQMKGCAMVAVDEIISICTTTYFQDYWKEVKNELEKLL